MSDYESLTMSGLTPKEKRIAMLLLYGKARKRIAGIIGIAESTVKSHTENIFKKIGVKTQKEFMSKYLMKDDCCME
ncbi:MAG: helix-turn-helix transcriptional regulator [Firmicutes bacterium]|nr:helix-turn-helix transcriptional regulator [Bacillota bacterium]